MFNFLTFSLLAATFGFGILCLRSPIKVSYVILRWTELASGGNIQNSFVSKAINLIKQNPDQYEKEFSAHVATIRRTGFIALIVSLVGFCLALLPS